MLKKLSIALVVFGFFFSNPAVADHHEEGEGAEMSDEAGDTMQDADHGDTGAEHADMNHGEDAGMGAKDKGKAKGADKGKKAGKKKGHDKHK